jgi:hypothetical protein
VAQFGSSARSPAGRDSDLSVHFDEIAPGVRFGRLRRTRRMIVQMVKYKSGLSDEEVRRVIAERAPQYEALAGLRQKLYISEPETGEYGGI